MNGRHGNCNIIIPGLLLLFTLMFALPADAGEQYTFAVVPNAPPLTLHKRWTPFIEQLSKDTGLDIKLKLYDSIDKFIEGCNQGEVDFVYSAPNMFYLAYEKQKYIPLLRSSENLKGRVFVRKDSAIRTIKELEGKRVAFVGNSNVCSVIVRDRLTRGGEIPIKFNKSFTGSTVNVAKAVLMGQADAGATLDSSFEKFTPDIKPELRSIYETPPIASHPIAAHPRIPKKIRDSVEKIIANYKNSDAGKSLLTQIGFADPVKADYVKDYSHFRSIEQFTN